MRSKIFTGALKVVGVPMFLVKWILKFIWFFTFGFVGFLYSAKFIRERKSGRVAYTVISTALLIGVALLFYSIKR